MRTLCYHHWSSLTLAERTPKPPLPPKSNIRQQPHKLLFHALTGTLSFNLIFLSPSPSIAQLISPPPPPVEYCKEEDVLEQEKPQTVPGLVTNQGIVEEAWEIVNESFLDYSDRPRFSPDNWLKKKEDAIGSSIQTRSKAHDIIQRMLGSLGDPYTRFLSPSEVIYTAGRDPQYQKSIVAESAPAFTAPLIVLVNNKTASASEIVATALRDNCRAILVGERTYGKGLIQSVFELHDGSGIVVTVGKYVTPNHMDIGGNGVEPDFKSVPAWSEVKRFLSQCQRNG